jgi:serine/threonine-protein kinase
MIAVGAETLSETARLVGGRYELEALIGKGGVGEVWRARHVALNSRVAIKFLQLASAEKESAQRRFTKEAQITAQLKTAHAVQVFDFGVTEDGQPYLVMELLEGETLGRRLERVNHLSVPEAVRLLGQAARALHRAHALGIVHRDFKPDNIVISVDDEGREQVKVLDFGVAKLLGALEEGVNADDGRAGDGGAAPSFTRTGAVLGTPLYMAPEQVRNPSEVDLKADIWAFGVVAFECLTGRSPFTGSSLPELFEHILASHHPSATFLEPSVPPGFDVWFEIACAPDPARRFMNASVAWKQLTVALNSDGQNSSGSFPGLEAHEQSGQRRVVVVPGEEQTDTSAPTLEGQPGELLARTHGDEFHSLRRIPRAMLASPSVRPPAPEPAATAPSGSPPRARRPWIAATVVGVAAVAGLTVWRVGGHASGGGVPASAGSQASDPTTTSAPADLLARSPAVTASSAAFRIAPASAALVPASATPPSPSASHAAARPAASSNHAVTAAAPAPAPAANVPEARQTAPQPAPSSTGAFDPGSYR